MNPLDALRRRPAVRGGAQVVVVLALLLAVLSFRDEVGTQDTTTDVVEALLVDACAANDQRTLRRENLDGPCALAREGEIAPAIRDRLDTVEEPEEVRDALADVDVPPPDPDSVETAVDDYLSTYDFSDLRPGYREGLRDEVERVLQTLGVQPPTRQQITATVAAYLVANPPKRGEAGVPGRGVVTARLNGCAVDFTYTDGTTDSIGPLCGRDGADAPPVTDDQVNAAVARYCEVNGCRGERGEQGEPGPAGYPISITLADGQECTDPDGDRRYTCSGGGSPIEPLVP